MSEQFGFVYILANASMPGLYKIGMTERSPMRRAAELSGGTGVPAPYLVVFYSETESPREVERACHKRFEGCRLSSGREFFSLSPEQLAEVVDHLSDNSVHALTTELGLKIMEPQKFGPYLQLFPSVVHAVGGGAS